jgi:sugar phosphate isomerase/epimerase
VLSITSDSLSNYGLHRVFRFVKEASFDGIEIIMTKDYDTHDANYLQELSNEYKLPIVAISAPDKTTKKRILSAIDIAKKINCQVIVIKAPELLDFKLSAWIKNEIPLIRKKEKLHICLENNDASTFLGILPKYAMNSLNDLTNFKSVCLNTANLASKKIDLMKVYDQLKSVIKHIHLSNSKGATGYLALNHGVLPLESFLTSLKDNNYSGHISLKIRPSELQTEDINKMMNKLKESREFYQKYFKI